MQILQSVNTFDQYQCIQVWTFILTLEVNTLLKKVNDFPVQGEFGKWHPGWGRENR
jgi:hypothetical protein